MFEIIYKGEIIGYTDKPIYIRNKNNIWVYAREEDAEGITFNNEAYPGAFAREEKEDSDIGLNH